jgi:hypothetical protein
VYVRVIPESCEIIAFRPHCFDRIKGAVAAAYVKKDFHVVKGQRHKGTKGKGTEALRHKVKTNLICASLSLSLCPLMN